MRRRDFISAVAAGSAAVGATGATGRAAAVETDDEGTIPSVVFDSAGSLLNADGEPLTDESVVAVWAATTATNTDADGDGDAVAYPDDAAIPLVAVDGSVVALGGTFVEEYAGSLAADGRDAYAYDPDGSGPIRIELAGPADADFDLFVTLDGREPTPADHDRRSWGPTAEESIVLGGNCSWRTARSGSRSPPTRGRATTS